MTTPIKHLAVSLFGALFILAGIIVCANTDLYASGSCLIVIGMCVAAAGNVVVHLESSPEV